MQKEGDGWDKGKHGAPLCYSRIAHKGSSELSFCISPRPGVA